MMARLSEDQRNQAIGMLKEGSTVINIAHHLTALDRLFIIM